MMKIYIIVGVIYAIVEGVLVYGYNDAINEKERITGELNAGNSTIEILGVARHINTVDE